MQGAESHQRNDRTADRQSKRPIRYDGLDVARFVAFVGMVVVNFTIVMGVEEGSSVLHSFVSLLEGRAAATFVTLAGIGLGLSTVNRQSKRLSTVIIKRALFLLVIGLLNMQIFDADIIHYYAFYFFFGCLFLTARIRTLIVSIVVINLVTVLMMLVFDYMAGWDFATFSYQGFWTVSGFVRNLFFNGWHPVFPWLSFLLFGILLSRLPLNRSTTQAWLIGGGVSVVALAELMSKVLKMQLSLVDPELMELVSTAAIPPMPLYVMAGAGSASIIIGLCLFLENRMKSKAMIEMVLPAGRQSLSLYFAHIFVGMGLLELFGMFEGQTVGMAIFLAGAFSWLSMIAAFFWSFFFKRGPLELAMRRVAG